MRSSLPGRRFSFALRQQLHLLLAGNRLSGQVEDTGCMRICEDDEDLVDVGAISTPFLGRVSGKIESEYHQHLFANILSILFITPGQPVQHNKNHFEFKHKSSTPKKYPRDPACLWSRNSKVRVNCHWRFRETLNSPPDFLYYPPH